MYTYPVIQKIFFDLYGTLIDLKGVDEFNRRLEQRLGPARFEIVEKHFIEAHLLPIEAEKWIRQTAEDIKATSAEVLDLQKKLHYPDWEVYPDVRPALETVIKKGLKIGLISNATMEANQSLQASGLLPYFDTVTLSYQIGARKPDKKIFEVALREALCEPAQAMMIGDSLEADIVGAKNAGMQAILLERKEGNIDNPKKIRSLLELEKLL